MMNIVIMTTGVGLVVVDVTVVIVVVISLVVVVVFILFIFLIPLTISNSPKVEAVVAVLIFPVLVSSDRSSYSDDGLVYISGHFLRF